MIYRAVTINKHLSIIQSGRNLGENEACVWLGHVHVGFEFIF